jgi:DMSO/TMAO reductase YedYZ molybdopterin-dependent catalytic subunit
MGQRNELFATGEEVTDLEVVKPVPLNAEAPARALDAPFTSPHFVRTNFDIPQLGEGHAFEVGGAVANRLRLDTEALRALAPSRTVAVTLECAGNGRTALAPLPEGEPWERGAVSTAQWRGVPLSAVLSPAVLRDDVQELVFFGADGGEFARALPLEKALDPDTLIAFEMNGKPIPARHGGPLRLIVPGWYAMASVKWLARIEATAVPFEGQFQTERYVYGPGAPVTSARVKALITSPLEDARVAPGELEVAGWAWSGSAEVVSVEVAVGGGDSWVEAELEAPLGRWAWRRFRARLRVDAPGRQTLRARATDARGATQPPAPGWNALGYGNNAVEVVTFHVRQA